MDSIYHSASAFSVPQTSAATTLVPNTSETAVNPLLKLHRLNALFNAYFSVPSNQASYPGQFILRLLDSAINCLETQMGYSTPAQDVSGSMLASAPSQVDAYLDRVRMSTRIFTDANLIDCPSNKLSASLLVWA